LASAAFRNLQEAVEAVDLLRLVARTAVSG
jgi:hypothetical protein